MDDTDFQRLRTAILDALDIDIEQYKGQQMRRRLGSFVERRADGDVRAFCRELASDVALSEELRDFLTINVSEFFRDPEQFEYLRSRVLPDLLAGTQTLRIWSAACASGEEPFSIAILLAEMNALQRARIVATDLDRKALARARAGGPYREQELRHVSRRQRLRFFTEAADGVRPRDELVRAVTFREHDLLRNDFERGYDLIVCRNVMIYFTAATKTQLTERLRDALRPGGVLFVGGTEAIVGPEQAGFRRLSGHFYRSSERLPVAA